MGSRRPESATAFAAELERLVAEGATRSALLPPEESVAVMETLDEVRRLIGVRYPGE